MEFEGSHVSREGFLSLVATDLDEEARRALLHGIACCPGCRRVVGPVFDLLERGILAIDFGVVDLSLAESREEAKSLLRELLELGSADRRRRLRTRRFRSWGLCELVIRASRQQRRGRGTESLELAQMGVELAGRLVEDEPCERAWLHELRAYALAHLAYAQCRIGERDNARKTFERAKKLWERGEGEVGDVLGYEAEIREIETLLEKRVGRRAGREAVKGRAAKRATRRGRRVGVGK